MLISLIVAMDEVGCIGKNGTLPWRLSSDLQRFRSLTMGHHLIMGRKTYESIRRPLPGRWMIIISRNSTYLAEGNMVVQSLQDALDAVRQAGESEVFIIGGGQIFTQSLPLAERIYLTLVHAQVECDTFFPRIDWDEWQIIQEEPLPADEKNQYPTTFRVLSRKHP